MKKVILFWQYILTNKLTIGRRKLKKKKETQGKLNNVIKTWKINYKKYKIINKNGIIQFENDLVQH